MPSRRLRRPDTPLVASKGNEKRGVADRAIVELEKEEEKRISTGNCE